MGPLLWLIFKVLGIPCGQKKYLKILNLVRYTVIDFLNYNRILEYFLENDKLKKSYSYLLLDLKLPPTFFFRGSNVVDRSNFKLFLLVSVNSRSNDLFEGTNFACFGPENISITFKINNVVELRFYQDGNFFEFLHYSNCILVAWTKKLQSIILHFLNFSLSSLHYK